MSDLAVRTTYSVMTGYWQDFIRDRIEAVKKVFKDYIDIKFMALQEEEKRMVLPVKLDKVRLYNSKGELVKEFYEAGNIVNETA